MNQRGKKPVNYAFIDSQNLNLGVQKAGWKLDWRKFRQHLEKQYNVTHAYMFIGYMAEYEALYEQMHDLGYLIVLKPTVDPKLFAKEGDKEKPADEKKPQPQTKGNVDADLVLYAMKEMPNYDKAIIVSGDGDFFGLIEYMLEKNKLLHILTPNWQYSSLLKPFEKYIVRIDQLRRQLAYKDFKKKKTQPPK